MDLPVNVRLVGGSPVGVVAACGEEVAALQSHHAVTGLSLWHIFGEPDNLVAV